MDIITYALLKNKHSGNNSPIETTISVNENGEIIATSKPQMIDIDFETGCLFTNSEIFYVNENDYLVSEV